MIHPIVQRLLDLQQQSGLTDGALGRKVGYSPQNLSNWRRYGKLPTLPVVTDFAQFFGYRLELVEDADVVDLPPWPWVSPRG